jgi:arsenite methyltransferase
LIYINTKGHIMTDNTKTSNTPQDDNLVLIRDVVHNRYADIAINRDTSASCCSDDVAECGISLYESDTSDLPVDVTGLSLGCGDPVAIASLKQGETVLDLGSGGGIDCFLASKQVGAEGRVIGVDMTPAMLEKANANKAKIGAPADNVEFRQGNIEALPVDSASVDVIMSNCVINLSPQKADVFGEAVRVLKLGGRIVISDIVTEGDFNEQHRADLEQWAECVTGAIDVNDYIALMREAGFRDISVVDKRIADDVIPVRAQRDDMPRVYSARIIAYK